MTCLDKTKRSKFNPAPARLPRSQKFWIAWRVLAEMMIGRIKPSTKHSGVFDQHAPMPYPAFFLLLFIAIRLALMWFGI